MRHNNHICLGVSQPNFFIFFCDDPRMVGFGVHHRRRDQQPAHPRGQRHLRHKGRGHPPPPQAAPKSQNFILF